MVRKIEFSNEMATQYAKKIFGFAYSKTNNTHQAEELAQEILCALVHSLRRQSDIVDMDGFVYTVSNNTWHNFLRKNKRHWNNFDVDAFHDLQSEQDVEAEVADALLIEKLRAEVVYLTTLHRKITIMFYYDNRISAEIASELDIPHSTIRWHLTEIKKKMKAGIEMSNNTFYEPRRLWCGHDGWTHNDNMRGIGRNPLVDNIVLVCYGKELTIEEIARTLQVAAAYIEPLVKELVYMDYMLVKNKNKYTTNFFIQTENFRLSEAKYKLHNIKPFAEKIIGAFRKYQDELKSIGFIGSDLDIDFLLWAFIPMALQDLYYESLNHVLKKNNASVNRPKRKDGSEHWVGAGLQNDSYDINKFTAAEVDFKYKINSNGIKTRNQGEEGKLISGLQYESYATEKIGISWREFEDMRMFERVATIIRDDETPNDYDKEMITSLVKQGYVKMENDRPKLLIPFLFADEVQKLNELGEKLNEETGENLFVDFIEGYAAEISKEIPSFISEDIRTYLKYQAYPQLAVMYWLADNGLLRYPTDEEAKRLCTIVWQN